ncbi:MAG: elongation factor 1-beta [Nanoarchaeota archaeon]|nr:elongation factor 1-beta [Nanoarchaeota archaeon]
MGTAAVKIKLMPTSPDVDLEDIKIIATKYADKLGAKNIQTSEELIAFGLKAIILFFAWNEDNELEPLEDKLRTIEDVQSVQVIDMRRAFG